MSRKQPQPPQQRVLPTEVKSKAPVTARDGAAKALPHTGVDALPDIHQPKKAPFQFSIDDDDFGDRVSSPRETAIPVSVSKKTPAKKPGALDTAVRVAEAVTKMKKNAGAPKTARATAEEAKPKEPKIYLVLFGDGDREEKHTRTYVNRTAKLNEGRVVNVRDTETGAEYTVKYAGLGDAVWTLIPQVQVTREKTQLELLIECAMDPEVSNLSDDCGDLGNLMREVNNAIRTSEHARLVDQLAAYLLAAKVIFFNYDEVEFFFNEEKVRCALGILSVFSNPASAFTTDLWQKLICIYLDEDVRRRQMRLMPTVMSLLEVEKRMGSDAEKYALVDDVTTNFCDPVNLSAIEAIQARLGRCGIALAEADSEFMLTHPVIGLLNNITLQLSSKASLDAAAWDCIKKQMQPVDYLPVSSVLDDGLSEKVNLQTLLQKTREQRSPVDEAVPLQRDPSFRRLGGNSSPLLRAGSFHDKAKRVTGSSSPLRTLSRNPSCRSVVSEADLMEVSAGGTLPGVVTIVSGNLAAPQALFGVKRTASKVRVVDADDAVANVARVRSPQSPH